MEKYGFYWSVKFTNVNFLISFSSKFYIPLGRV